MELGQKRYADGTPLKFSEASGNSPDFVEVESSEQHNGMWFHRLVGKPGGLWLDYSLEVR